MSVGYWTTELRRVLAERKVAYLAPDAGRTLGLRTLLGEMVTVCFDTMGVPDVPGCPLLAVSGDDPDEVRGSASLLENPDVVTFLRSHGVTDIVAFKVNARLLRRAEELGLCVFAGSPTVAQRFENKIHFSGILSNLGIPAPKTVIYPDGLSYFEPGTTPLTPPWIVQAARGHSGQTTWIVADVRQWAELRMTVGALPGRVSEYVPGPTWTVNGAVLDSSRVAVGPGFRQITGVPELTPFPLGACGNCWGVPSATEPELRDLARNVGMALAAAGYRGAFGVDVVVSDDGRMVVIETNPRITSGQAMESVLLQAKDSVSPLLWHLLTFGGSAPLDLPVDPSAVIMGSQLVFYNPEPADGVLMTAPRSGTYEWTEQQLVWRGQGVNPAACAPNQVVVLARTQGRRVPKGAEVLRVQSNTVWLSDSSDHLTEEAGRVVNTIRQLFSVCTV